jgi:hypothetical protein
MVHHPSSVTPGLAIRAELTDADIERIEEGGSEPTCPLPRRLAVGGAIATHSHVD